MTPIKPFVLGLAFALLAPAPLFAQSATPAAMPASPTAEDSIRRLLDAQVAGWNAGDAAAWSREFVPDAGFVNILGMRFQGRQAYERRHAELFATLFKGSHLDLQELTVRTLGDSAAIAEAVLDLTHFPKLPPGIRPSIGKEVLRTRMLYVLVREGSDWHIVFSQNTAVMPMPPSE